VPTINGEYMKGGCSDGTVSALIEIAKKHPALPDPMSYIARCQAKAGNKVGACSAVKEYIRRGASPAQAAAIQKSACPGG